MASFWKIVFPLRQKCPTMLVLLHLIKNYYSCLCFLQQRYIFNLKLIQVILSKKNQRLFHHIISVSKILNHNCYLGLTFYNKTREQDCCVTSWRKYILKQSEQFDIGEIDLKNKSYKMVVTVRLKRRGIKY